MIYLLSDLHGDWAFLGWQDYLKKATDEDLLIILGDVGLSFEKTQENARFTEEFLQITKKVAFLDGNHENFAYLESFPEEEWCGGRVRRLSPYIVKLERGEVYKIEGKRVFAFGGCKSTDKWKERGLWYEGEEPSDAQIANAHRNLARYEFCVDYVLTHKYSQTPIPTSCPLLDELVKYIDENVSFAAWYAGHWHQAAVCDEKHFFVYDVLTLLA